METLPNGVCPHREIILTQDQADIGKDTWKPHLRYLKFSNFMNNKVFLVFSVVLASNFLAKLQR